MNQLPPILAARYRPATDDEVRSHSFGILKAPRNLHANTWEQRRGTLEDQAIFGPIRDFECACGKYRGQKYEKMICDRCGVKVTVYGERRRRFAHVELPEQILHPLGPNAERLSAIPVLPAMLTQSPGAGGLADLYDQLVQAALSKSVEGSVQNFGRIVELLLPVVTIAHEWNLQDAITLAWGLALEQQGPRGTNHRCGHCGYPLEGLDVPTCPGCGKNLE
jgi:hypothetical protein